MEEFTPIKFYEEIERILTKRIETAIKNAPGRKIMTDSINELAAALSLARREFKPLEFNRINPMVLSEYVDYYAVFDATKDALADHGITLVHAPQDNGQHTVLISFVLHESGQYISCESVLNSMVHDTKVWTSQLNECKKQHALSLLGISATNNEQDDDLEAEAHREGANPFSTVLSYVPINKTELDELDYELSGDDMKDVYDNILKTMRINRLSELPKTKYRRVKEVIQSIKQNRAGLR